MIGFNQRQSHRSALRDLGRTGALPAVIREDHRAFASRNGGRPVAVHQRTELAADNSDQNDNVPAKCAIGLTRNCSFASCV